MIARTSGGETKTAETADELTTVYENLGSKLSLNLDVEPSTRPLVIAAIALTVLAGLCSCSCRGSPRPDAATRCLSGFSPGSHGNGVPVG